MQSDDLTRRDREKLAHRREILDAALALFAERGFHDVTMQQVAEKAEFSIGSLYNYFENKDDIYRTLLMELSDEFQAAISEAVEAGRDPVEKLGNYIVAMGRVFRENLDFIRLYHRETAGVGVNPKAGFDEVIRRRHTEFLEVLAGIFADGMAGGRFRHIAEPRLLALALEGLVKASLLDCLEDPDGRTFPDDPGVLLDILFEGLLVP